MVGFLSESKSRDGFTSLNCDSPTKSLRTILRLLLGQGRTGYRHPSASDDTEFASLVFQVVVQRLLQLKKPTGQEKGQDNTFLYSPNSSFLYLTLGQALQCLDFEVFGANYSLFNPFCVVVIG